MAIEYDRIVAVVSTFPSGSKKLGTGYLTDSCTVLTARHCLEKPDETGTRAISVNVYRAVDGQGTTTTQFIMPNDVDVAIIKIEPIDIWPLQTPQIAYARIHRHAEKNVLDCIGIGFSNFSRSGDDTNWSTNEFHGKFYRTDGMDSDELVVRDPYITPVPQAHVDSAKFTSKVYQTMQWGAFDQAARPYFKPWAGFSGTLLFYRDQAVGVVTEHRPTQGPSTLRAVTFEKLLKKASSDRNARLVADSLGIQLVEDLADADKRAVLSNQASTINFRQARDLGSSHLIESDALHKWDTWDRQKDWYVRLKCNLLKIEEGINQIGLERDTHIQATMELFAQRSEYTTVRNKLRKLETKSIEKLARKTIAEEHNRDILEAAQNVLTAVKWIQQQTKTPTYEYCINYAGNFGSGRSRILTEIAQRVTERGDFVLFLELNNTKSALDTMLTQASQLFGEFIGDLNRLNDVTQKNFTQNSRLYVMIDDLDRAIGTAGEGLNDFQALIDRTSAFSSIRWICSADKDRFDTILNPSDPYFWRDYGYMNQKTIENHTGWVDVDDCNSRQLVGLQLLKELAATEDADIDEFFNDTTSYAYERQVLANPLPAWFRWAAHEEGSRLDSPVTNVNEPEFVRLYWHWIKKRASTKNILEMDLENAVVRLARAFMESYPEFPKISKQGVWNVTVNTPNGSVDLPEATINALRSVNLVHLRVEGNPEVEEQVQYLHWGFPPIWGLRIANLIIADAQKSSIDDDLVIASNSPWIEQACRYEGLAEATCQFVLSSKGAEIQSQGERLWVLWGKDNRYPKVPFLMAATTNDRGKKVAIKAIARSRFPASSKRELFVLLRFLQRCEHVEWGADQRIDVICDRYSAIGEHGLITYLYRVIQSVLEDSDLLRGDNYVNTCTRLVGVEQAGDASVVAEVLVHAGQNIFENDIESWIKRCTDFLYRIAPSSRSDSKGSKGKSRSPKRRFQSLVSDDRSTFVERFIDQVSMEMVRSYGADGCRILAKYGWWDGELRGIDRKISSRMSIALTTNYGSTLHGRNIYDKSYTDYLEVVDQLVDGGLTKSSRAHQRKIAFYLIKHSCPTYGNWDVHVADIFHDALHVIRADKQANKEIGVEGQKLYRVNDIRL